MTRYGEVMAQAFHEAYERLAPSFGYETREASAKPWTEVPEQNRALMVATCDAILVNGTLTVDAMRDAAVKVWTKAYQRLRELEESGSHGCENGAAKAYEAGRITALSADLWEALGVPRPDDFNVRPVLPVGDSDEIIAKRRADLDQALNGGGAQKRMGGLST